MRAAKEGGSPLSDEPLRVFVDGGRLRRELGPSMPQNTSIGSRQNYCPKLVLQYVGKTADRLEQPTRARLNKHLARKFVENINS